MTAIAINGLGERIGRAFLKVAMTRQELRVVAVSDLIDPENLVYLLRVDSADRRYDQPVAYEPGVEPTLLVGRTRMRLLREREPARLPWKKLGVDIVIEATGAFATFEQARAHTRLERGMAMRVPVLTGSISSIVFLAGRPNQRGGDQRAVGGRVTATAPIRDARCES